MTLKIHEIYESIHGESSFVGLPSVFVRLQGCNLNCRYCDTMEAREGNGTEMTVEEVVEKAISYGWRMALVTGGEPLLQEETPRLVQELLHRGCQVVVETNGSLDISVIPKEATRIMDIKCPSSGEAESNLWDNLFRLYPPDEVKFVLSNRHDYEWAVGIIKERFEKRRKLLFTTVFGELPPTNLVEWMLEDKIWARFQLGIHRYVWPGAARSV